MYLINEYRSVCDAEQDATKLRKRGILTFVSSKNSYILSSIHTGVFKVGLWAVLQNQYEDACKIISKQQCKVRHPLTEEEMITIESQTKNNAPATIIKGLLIGVTILLSIFLSIAWYQYK